MVIGAGPDLMALCRDHPGPLAVVSLETLPVQPNASLPEFPHQQPNNLAERMVTARLTLQ